MIDEGVQNYTLDNGLSLIIIHDPRIKGVCVEAQIKVGSCDEQLDRDRGICHLLEHIVWCGTKDYSEEEVIAEISGKGGSSNAFTSYHATGYHGWCRRDYLGDFISVLDSVIFRPNIDKDRLETEKVVVLEEIARDQSDQGSVCWDRAVSALYPHHTFRHPILGFEESVSQMKATRVREYMRSYHRPQGMVLGLMGDLPSLEEWSAILHERAHGFSRKTRAANAIDLDRDFGDATPISSSSVTSETWENVQSSYIERLYPIHIAKTDSKQRIASGLLNRIVGGGEYSLMFTEIRREAGLAYACGAFKYGTLDVGAFGMYTQTIAKNVKQVNDICDSIVKRVRKGDFSDQKFELAKNQMLGEMEQMMNSPMALLRYHTRSFHEPDPKKRLTPEQVLALLEKTTKKDVIESARAVFDQPYSQHTILNEE